MREYRWKITRDHIGDGSTGVEGPRGLDPNLKENPVQFWMYDDDNICYYSGWLYGEYQGDEPLLDYGLPNAGACHIKLAGDTGYLY